MPEPLTPEPDAHDPYAALRHRDYRFLLSGNVLAAISAEVTAVAVGWELFDRTGSAAALGYAGLAQFLPVLLLALPAGQLADRKSRKHLLIIAHATMLLASIGLAALSYWHGPIPIVYLCLAVAGCARALGMPARTSLIPLLVPTHHLPNAVAWSSTGWQIANVSGPALGGLFYAMAPYPAVTYLAAAFGLANCILLVTTITNVRPRAPEPLPSQFATAITSVAPRLIETRWQSLLAGLRFVWNNELLLAAITLDLFAVLLGGATALLPIFAKNILAIGPIGLGCLRAAPALGALVTALVVSHRPPLQRPGVAILYAVAGFGIATIGFGLSDNAYLSFLLLALIGAFDNISVVVRGTLMQVLTPDSMRGRVAATNAIFISSSNELGSFESGITAEWFGPVASVVGGGYGTILVVVMVIFYWPRLRSLGPLHTLRRETL